MQLAAGHRAFANGGRTFAAIQRGSSGNAVALCDLTQPEKPPILFPERGGLYYLAASPDSRLVAVGTQYGLVVLYDTETMERKKVFHGHSQSVFGVKFSPDGKSLMSSSGGLETVKIWHVETGQELLTLRGAGSIIDHVQFVDNGNALLAGSGGQQGTWQIWRAPPWEQIAAIEAKEKTEIRQP